MRDYIATAERNCDKCLHERRRRHRVLSSETIDKAQFQKEPYNSAPALYSFNVPRHFSTNLRAREFAKQTHADERKNKLCTITLVSINVNENLSIYRIIESFFSRTDVTKFWLSM